MCKILIKIQASIYLPPPPHILQLHLVMGRWLTGYRLNYGHIWLCGYRKKLLYIMLQAKQQKEQRPTRGQKNTGKGKQEYRVLDKNLMENSKKIETAAY